MNNNNNNNSDVNNLYNKKLNMNKCKELSNKRKNNSVLLDNPIRPLSQVLINSLKTKNNSNLFQSKMNRISLSTNKLETNVSSNKIKTKTESLDTLLKQQNKLNDNDDDGNGENDVAANFKSVKDKIAYFDQFRSKNSMKKI
jgi:hypothetical protein